MLVIDVDSQRFGCCIKAMAERARTACSSNCAAVKVIRHAADRKLANKTTISTNAISLNTAQQITAYRLHHRLQQNGWQLGHVRDNYRIAIHIQVTIECNFVQLASWHTVPHAVCKRSHLIVLQMFRPCCKFTRLNGVGIAAIATFRYAIREEIAYVGSSG